MPNIELICGDCEEGMKDTPDNFYELAIVDVQYGINIGKSGKVGGDKPFGSKQFRHGIDPGVVPAKEYKPFDDSHPPDSNYFDLLIQKSRNQIIWGANHFIDNFPFMCNSPCWIVWDKDKSGFFADGELAWTSFDSAVRIFKYRWNGMLQENMKNKEHRIHPTQKPVALYKWLLKNYAKPGDRILDTHFGSLSIGVACIDMGFDLVAYEIDEDYFNSAIRRLKNHIRQLNMFQSLPEVVIHKGGSIVSLYEYQ